MQKLTLPEYSFRIRDTEGKKQIFDSFRKKFVALTPEEWVRQNFLMYLVNDKQIPPTVVSVETALKVYSRKKRTDIVVHNRSGKPVMIVECKAPDVTIDDTVFDQIVRYNFALNVQYFVLTNGLNHFCCHVDYQNKSYTFLDEIPVYELLLAT